MVELAEATAIITGAGSGIGRAAAISLARRGTHIVVADLDPEAADATVARIAELGGGATAVPCDVTHADTYTRLRDHALTAHGRIDIVMNNVGALTRGLPEHIPVDEWQRVLDLNLMTAVRSNDVFLPILLAQRAGHIVNTASFAGLYPYAYDRLPYAAAKAALVSLSEGLALYLRPHGIGVTVLCPGPVRTNIVSSIRSFGPATTTRGPGAQFPVLDPADVGEMVADAITANTFFLPTHPDVRAELQRRAADWNQFIATQTEALQ